MKKKSYIYFRKKNDKNLKSKNYNFQKVRSYPPLPREREYHFTFSYHVNIFSTLQYFPEDVNSNEIFRHYRKCTSTFWYTHKCE